MNVHNFDRNDRDSMMRKSHVFSKYFCGIFWFLLSMFIGVCNDALMKYLSEDYSAQQTVCIRYMFAAASLTVLPFFGFSRKNFITKSPMLHLVRSIILLAAFMLYCSSLKKIPISTVTVFNMSIPLFTLVLAYFLLGEKIGTRRTIATIIGFIGLCIVFRPFSGNIEIVPVISLLLSSILFALSDIINKKYVINEGIIPMLFYTAIMMFVLSAPFAIREWQDMPLHDLMLFFFIGIGANLLFYFLLKSFKNVDISVVAPFRYFELALGCVVGYYFFSEIPKKSTLIGAMIVIPCVIYTAVSEKKARITKVNNIKCAQ